MSRITSFLREGRNYILAVIIVLVVTFAAMHYVVSPVGGDRKPVLVIVPKGATAGEIGLRLKDAGLIHFSWVFPLMAGSSGDATKLRAGAYQFNKSMTVRQMLDKIVIGDVAAVWVTIPEGFTTRQIADRLARRHLVRKQEFLMLTQSGGREFTDILDTGAPELEGYLYPSTYLVLLSNSPREIVADMLKTFKEHVAEPMKGDIDKVASDQSPESRAAALHRVMIVASLIEREAKKPGDRPLISAVIWNRLRIGMKLNIDATIEYALGGHRERIFYKDLAVQSPYNTYSHAGLPPGPIANPGLPSIKAALHPANVDYLYYVARPDGSHAFSRTLQEHDAARQRIRRGH